jgi:hypothetical protein
MRNQRVGIPDNAHLVSQRVPHQQDEHECEGGLDRGDHFVRAPSRGTRAPRRTSSVQCTSWSVSIAGHRGSSLRTHALGPLTVALRAVRQLDRAEDQAGDTGRVERLPEALHLVEAGPRPRRSPTQLGQRFEPNGARPVQRDAEQVKVAPHDDAEERARSRGQVPLAQVPDALHYVVNLRDEQVPAVGPHELRAVTRAYPRV